MPDNKRDQDRSIPPPLDPFPAYQAPFPRATNNDDQNPFIQFRRFADEQFSAFFQGVPSLFGFHHARDPWKQDLDDLQRRRQAWEEGWKKQLEQDMEEARQELAKSATDLSKWMDDARRPAQELQGPPLGPQSCARKCPAWNAEEPGASTELDLYSRLPDRRAADDDLGHVFPSPPPNAEKRPASTWLSSLGWDGKQKAQRGTTQTDDGTSAASATCQTTALPPPRRYTSFKVRHMEPFDDTDDTLPWLMLSPYSPVYLCNPAQSRLFKVRMQDAVGAPFQISRPVFAARWYSEVDEKMAHLLPWADAFEDLLSLQQTGKMVERDYSTWRTPSTWIHDMVYRGSLGPRWGFNHDGLLMKLHNASDGLASAPPKQGCRWRGDRRRECEARSKDASTANDGRPGADDDFIDDLVDQVTKPLAEYPLVGSILSAADSIVAAVGQSQGGVKETTAADAPPFPSTLDHQVEAEQPLQPLEAPTSPTPAPDASATPKSITSILTTTLSRTLEDGSVETKRVLKRRFADGTEETNEEVDRKYPSSSRPTSTALIEDKETQTPAIAGIFPEGTAQARMHPEPLAPTDSAPARADLASPSEPSDAKTTPTRKSGWFWT